MLKRALILILSAANLLALNTVMYDKDTREVSQTDLKMLLDTLTLPNTVSSILRTDGDGVVDDVVLGNRLSWDGTTLNVDTEVEDDAVTSDWNTETSLAPSKNSLYDYFILSDTDIDGLPNKLDATSGIIGVDGTGTVFTITIGGGLTWNGTTLNSAASIADSVFGLSWDTVTTTGASLNSLFDYLSIGDTDYDGLANKLDATSGIVKVDGSGVVGTVTIGTGLSFDGTTLTASASIEDIAFASSWNANSAGATKNVLYNYLHTADTDDDGLANKVDLSSAGFVKTDASGNLSSVTDVLTSANVSDAALDSSWNTVTTIAPSKNAIHDYLVTGDTDLDGLPDKLDLNVQPGYVRVDLSGNIRSYNPYRNIWIGAGAFSPTAASGAAPGTYTPSGTDGVSIDVYDFDDTTAEGINIFITMPEDWDLTTLKAKFYWTSASGTGGVVWGIAMGATSDDDAIGSVLGTEYTVADTLLASNDQHVSAATSNITVAGSPAGLDGVWVKVRRLPSDASDTKTGDARLIGVMFQYHEANTDVTAW